MKSQNILGISAGFHDAALTLLDQHGKIVFAGHSERYSKQKNDADISSAMLDEIDMSQVDTIAYYERPWMKQLRQWYAGQGIEWNKVTTRQILKQQLVLTKSVENAFKTTTITCVMRLLVFKQALIP